MAGRSVARTTVELYCGYALLFYSRQYGWEIRRLRGCPELGSRDHLHFMAVGSMDRFESLARFLGR